MISGLTSALKPLLRRLEADIRERSGADDEVDARLRREHAEAREAERTAATFNAWRDEQVTQSAVAWILGCVFIRFLEDNELVSTVWLSGPGERLQLARDQEMLFYRAAPTASARDYLEYVFREHAKLATLEELFDEAHNPLWHLPPSGDGARELLGFFRKTDPDTGELGHNFTDTQWNTRFLGDLYQDLSETARKKYALLQTPEFVEEFILDRTLTPVIETFGLRDVRLIDPTCGSGHFLLGAFRRVLEQWMQVEPGTNVRALAQRALDAVYGVDLNPFAVAIARFRLLVEALRACEVRKLEHALAFRINLAVGDSLLHGIARQQYMPGFEDSDPIGFVYETEDADELRRILKQRYHAVVGNPPYITVKDKALNQAYRDRYGSCHRKYSLAVPFMERFFGLAVPKAGDAPAGVVGMITANSFMKREFGRKLVEEYIPRWDLTHVIDTSGAYIPGHGTPTVILFGRNRQPVEDTIRAVLGIRGEPGTPADPATGEVWTAILDQVDHPGSESDYLSVEDVPRERFHSHPWSIQGGGTAELRRVLESGVKRRLGERVDSVGCASFTGTDEVFVANRGSFLRACIPLAVIRPFVYGEVARDWAENCDVSALAPYGSDHAPIGLEMASPFGRYMWPYRTSVWGVVSFAGKTRRELGDPWWTWYRWIPEKYRTPLSIAFAFVATHNHFVLDRGGKVFNRTAPVIKLPADATEDEHLELLGLLNSSTACFWGRQALFPKGGFASGKWEERLEWDGTKVKQFPIPKRKPLALPKELDRLGQQMSETRPDAVVTRWHAGGASAGEAPLRKALAEAHGRFVAVRARMIAVQEELDWQCYHLYGLTTNPHLSALREGETGKAVRQGSHAQSAQPLVEISEDKWFPPLRLGQRAFEMVMARGMAAGELETTWFERHGSTPITAFPAAWPDAYRAVVEARIAEIANNKKIRLIEKPEYKRRWQVEPWDKQVEKALYEWLANRLEYTLSGRDLMKETTNPHLSSLKGGGESTQPKPSSLVPIREDKWFPCLLSCAQLSLRLQSDDAFQEVATLYTGRPDFDIANLVTRLVEGEGVPNLPRFRYKESGLRKRADWEHVWELQREEDEFTQRREDAEEEGDKERAREFRRQIDALDIPVPPKYRSADFAKTSYWRLRGKLDVPKERFILYPGCEREGDPTPVLTWAGWDHLQQAQALAAWYTQLQDAGASEDRLLLVLAGIADLLPWLKQWHNDIDPEYQMRMGDFYAEFVDGEARRHGTTLMDCIALTKEEH